MECILVIEDEQELLDEISDILIFEGYEVLKAANGIDGLDIAGRNNPDVILCDIIMPQTNGFEVLNELRSDDKLCMIPFIFITARTERVNLRLGMDMGADDYLIKPFTRKELLNSINTRLNKFRAVRTSVNGLKEQVVRSLPHEFRTPLNAILGFSKIIQEDAGNYSLEDISEMADHIFKSGVSLFRISQKYLTYIDIISHDQPFYYDEIEDAKKLISKIADEVAQEHNRLDDLILEIADCKLKLTEVYFIFAIREIIDNAFKFSSIGTKVEVIAEIKGYDFHIYINDHGIGFPEGTIKRIDAFHQFNAGNNSSQGVGLGLYLARRIAEINYGAVNIFSVPGRGTKVSIVLPSCNKISEILATNTQCSSEI